MLIKKSKMSGKLLGLDAINSNTLSNEFCKKEHKSPVQNKLCKECYYSLKQSPTTLKLTDQKFVNIFYNLKLCFFNNFLC